MSLNAANTATGALDTGFAIMAILTAAGIVAIMWAILTEAKETRRRRERAELDASIEAELMPTAVAIEASERAEAATRKAMTRRRLATVTDELGEWAPSAHAQVDAFLFEQTRDDFAALRRWVSSDLVGASA